MYRWIYDLDAKIEPADIVAWRAATKYVAAAILVRVWRAQNALF